MKIIGRDRLLEREILPRVMNRKGFLLVGQRGIGKSTILEWAYNQCDRKKVLVSCMNTYGDIIKSMAKELEITIAKKKVSEIEEEVMKGERVSVFLDDCNKMTPKQALFFTSYNEVSNIYMAGLEPVREEAKRIVWGKKKLRVHPIAKEKRREMGEFIVGSTGSSIALNTIANESKGVPARAWAIARGEYVRDEEERVEGEEVNIAPALMLAVGGIMVMRYIAVGMGEKDLYILGGICMGLAYFLRLVIVKISK